MIKRYLSKLAARKLMAALTLILSSGCAMAQLSLSSTYFSIQLDNRGYITSMKNTSVTPNREFSPSDNPSPLLALYDSKKNLYYYPTSAVYGSGSVQLSYTNGSVATVNFSTVTNTYFKFVLQDVVPRNGIDVVQWGPYNTNITNLFGELIGVARDTSEAGNFAIGALALNDSTVGGLASWPIDGSAGGFYVIHSPDPSRFPLPPGLHEGDNSSIGGNGISDVAFYSHPEEYYRLMNGNTAGVDTLGRISFYYHARDRRKKRTAYPAPVSTLPALAPSHQDIQPIPVVDIKGSAIAFYGCPDSVALLGAIKNIVLNERLPYPTYATNGSSSQVWIKDPARYTPDAGTGGPYDSILSYVSQLGFKAIEAGDLGFFSVNLANGGYIDGNPATNFPFSFTTGGNKTHKQFSDLASPLGIFVGRHTITTSLPPGTGGVAPVPSDSLCVVCKRILAKGICATDQNITVVDPLYLNEISSEGHDASINMIRIGKELIYYLGVSSTPPYTLQNVQRGAWGTAAAGHKTGDTIYKIQGTTGSGYTGLVPDMYLQDSVADYYADMGLINGLYFEDWDGQEFLGLQGLGTYSVKRFFRRLTAKLAAGGVPYFRFTGSTLSEGSWHYQSVWDVGGSGNMYNPFSRAWGIEGKDLRNTSFANYFPASFGSDCSIGSGSTTQEFENVEATSVGIGVTYLMLMNQTNVESCAQKYGIFSAVKTWENARAASAFPRMLKKQLADPTKYWHLAQVDANTWNLYTVNSSGGNPVLYQTLTRAAGY